MNPDIHSKLTFKDLGIQKGFLAEALEYFGFEYATPVQEQCIPRALTGENLVVQAKNGTGKTLAFSLIALETLEPSENHLQVMIVTSVREVASQICDFFNEMTYASATPIYSLLCCGGYSRKDTIAALAQGVHAVIGTVGRIKDLSHSHLNLSRLALLVLDEADKVCSEAGFLFSLLPKTCQILCFSATYTAHAEASIIVSVPRAQLLKISGNDMKLHELQEFYAVVSGNFQAKLTKVLELLTGLPFHQCIIFHNFKGHGKDLAARLRDCGFSSLNISSDLPQEQRIEVIRSLRFLKTNVLLSTDISSRGLDVLNVNLVINFDFPQSKEAYIHRVGRAGRFGTSGIAVALCENEEQIKKLGEFSVVKPLETFEKTQYVMRQLTEEEKLLQEVDEEWVDVPVEEELDKIFTGHQEKFSSLLEPEVAEAVDKSEECAFCKRNRKEAHCHCPPCLYNYEFLVKYS